MGAASSSSALGAASSSPYAERARPAKATAHPRAAATRSTSLTASSSLSPSPAPSSSSSAFAFRKKTKKRAKAGVAEPRAGWKGGWKAVQGQRAVAPAAALPLTLPSKPQAKPKRGRRSPAVSPPPEAAPRCASPSAQAQQRTASRSPPARFTRSPPLAARTVAASPAESAAAAARHAATVARQEERATKRALERAARAARRQSRAGASPTSRAEPPPDAPSPCSGPGAHRKLLGVHSVVGGASGVCYRCASRSSRDQVRGEPTELAGARRDAGSAPEQLQQLNAGATCEVDLRDVVCPCGTAFLSGTDSAMCCACGTATCSAKCHGKYCQEGGICVYSSNFVPAERKKREAKGGGCRCIKLRDLSSCKFGDWPIQCGPKFVWVEITQQVHVLKVRRGMWRWGDPHDSTLRALKVLECVDCSTGEAAAPSIEPAGGTCSRSSRSSCT